MVREVSFCLIGVNQELPDSIVYRVYGVSSIASKVIPRWARRSEDVPVYVELIFRQQLVADITLDMAQPPYSEHDPHPDRCADSLYRPLLSVAPDFPRKKTALVLLIPDVIP
jgi:hypothetical protein